MYDLNSLSLKALIRTAIQSDLIEEYRTTDWVIVLTVGGQELVMSHSNAHIFVQGLIYGSAQARRLSLDPESRSAQAGLTAQVDQRSMVG